MAITVDVNGVPIQYPQTGDTGWGDNATQFAEEVASVLGKIGQSQAPVNDDIIVSPGNLSVTSGNFSVGGNASVTGNTTLTGNLSVNGNSTLGNGTSDTTAISGILNVDSGVLYVDPTNNRVGINDATPSVELDVNGSVAITGNETVGGTLGITGATSLSSTLGVTGDVAVNTNKFNVTASSGNTTIAGTLGVTGNTTVDGVIYADDNTTANTPVISFTGDTNTGIGRSAADTIDFITEGVSRAKINSTGQQSSVIPDLSGSNTNLFNEYKCRAWVNFTGVDGSISKSGNVTSVTKNATGDFTVIFSTAMPDSNFAVFGMAKSDDTSSARAAFMNFSSNNTATDASYVRVNTLYENTNFRGTTTTTVGIFR